MTNEITPTLNEKEKENAVIINNQIRNLKKSLGTNKCFDIDECIARIKCLESNKCVTTNNIINSQAKDKRGISERRAAYHKFIQDIIQSTRPTEKLLSQVVWVNKYLITVMYIIFYQCII